MKARNDRDLEMDELFSSICDLQREIQDLRVRYEERTDDYLTAFRELVELKGKHRWRMFLGNEVERLRRRAATTPVRRVRIDGQWVWLPVGRKVRNEQVRSHRGDC
jgi:hypothetical protein